MGSLNSLLVPKNVKAGPFEIHFFNIRSVANQKNEGGPF